jgi:hypothetical protein
LKKITQEVKSRKMQFVQKVEKNKKCDEFEGRKRIDNVKSRKSKAMKNC